MQFAASDYEKSFATSLPLLDSAVPWVARKLCYAARGLPYYGRSLPILASLSPPLRETVIETEQSGRICIDLRERVCIPLFVHGCYRHQLPQDVVLDSLLRRGMRVFDIGANIGYYTAFASRRVGEAGQVIAVEPTNRAFRLLRRTGELCQRNVVILQAAVGETPGLAEFHEQKSLDTSFVEFRRASGPRSIAVLTIDRLTRDYGPPDVVKIDIEGAEIHALKGATETLAAALKPIVMVEYIATNAARFGQYALADMLQRFSPNTFHFYRIVAPGRLRRVGEADDGATNDFLAVPQARLSEIAELIVD